MMKGKYQYTQADMDSVVMCYKREKELKEIAMENFEEMQEKLEKVSEIEKHRLKLIAGIRKFKDYVVRTSTGHNASNRYRHNVREELDRMIEKLEGLKVDGGER